MRGQACTLGGLQLTPLARLTLKVPCELTDAGYAVVGYVFCGEGVNAVFRHLPAKRPHDGLLTGSPVLGMAAPSPLPSPPIKDTR